MKKGKAIALVAAGLVAGLALGSVGIAYAVAETGPAGCAPGLGMGRSIRDAGGRLVDIVAELTGLTVEEVRAARAEGESFADIAEANGSSADEVVEAALEARKEFLDSKVEDGVITQEQADAAFERMSERLNERITADEVGPPAWSGGGQGRGMGRGACGQGLNGL